MTAEAAPPPAELVAQIRQRRAEIDERIAAAGGMTSGRDRVVVVAVTKTHPAHVCTAAVAAGLADLGESYARELVDKSAVVEGATWHFIGQLQTNKVRLVAGHVALYQSVDRLSLVRELAVRDPGASVLIEIDLAETPGRGGCSADQASSLVDAAREAGLVVAGVMGVAPPADAAVVAASFRRLRSIRDAERLEICSAGMSDDFEIAVSEGSNMVRIGSAIFGPRP